MIVETKHPILAASMNHVSEANLAIACSKAGILPSISILCFIDKSVGKVDIQGFEKDLKKFNQETGSSDLCVSIGSKSLLAPKMIEEFRRILSEINYSHIELLITKPLELPNDRLSKKDIELFDTLKKTLDYIIGEKDIKIIYKAIDVFSVIELETRYGRDFFDSYMLKGPTAAGTVSSRYNKSITLYDMMDKVWQVHPDASVIACGGISDHSQISDYLQIGAEAVAIGTVLAASKESVLSDTAKNQYIEKQYEDVKKINGSYTGNQNGIFFSKIKGFDDRNNTMSLLKGIATGNEGHLFAGGAISGINEILSVQDIVNNLTDVDI